MLAVFKVYKTVAKSNKNPKREIVRRLSDNNLNAPLNLSRGWQYTRGITILKPGA